MEDKSTFENKLPSLIIYQLLHILAKIQPMLVTATFKDEFNELIMDFLRNSGWLHIDLDNKEECQW